MIMSAMPSPATQMVPQPAPAAVAEQNPWDAILRRTCQFIESNLDGSLTAAVLGHGTGVSPAQLNRTFKQLLGITVRDYVNARRFALFKLNLGLGRSVADATYEAGYGSSRAA